MNKYANHLQYHYSLYFLTKQWDEFKFHFTLKFLPRIISTILQQNSQPLWSFWSLTHLFFTGSFFSLEGKHHYWPLACFFNLNGWSERCNTFGHLIVQMDAAWGYFSPFPHEWACQFILASGVYITEVNDTYDNKCILFSQLLLFIFSIFLLFYGLYYVISLICIIQVDFWLLTTFLLFIIYILVPVMCGYQVEITVAV